jgi:hypothetical protein
MKAMKALKAVKSVSSQASKALNKVPGAKGQLKGMASKAMGKLQGGPGNDAGPAGAAAAMGGPAAGDGTDDGMGGDVPMGPLPTYTAADQEREIQLDLEEKNNLLERRKVGLEKRRVKAMERMAKSNLRLFMLAFLKDLSPYIVLFFILMLIIFLSKGGSFMRPLRRLDNRRRTAFAKAQSRWQRFKRWIREKLQWLIKLFTPGYRTRLFLQMFMPFGGKSNYVPRQRVMSGRCDNQRWIQIDENNAAQLEVDGKRGFCFSAIRPEDIEWQLDVSQMPDFHELPETTRKEMQKRMSIVIPYDKEDSIRDGNTFFIPRCDKAYYKNARDSKGKPIAAKLLEDTGTSCKLASHPLVKGSYGAGNPTREDLIQRRRL